MARLIDADDLVEKFWKPECRTQTRRDFVAMVDYAPHRGCQACGAWAVG